MSKADFIRRLGAIESLMSVQQNITADIREVLTSIMNEIAPAPQAFDVSIGGRPDRTTHLPILHITKSRCVNEHTRSYYSPSMVFDLCHDMALLDREHFVTLHLDGKNTIIARETVSIGSLQQAIVHPREVFKAAVHNGSAALILVHNHPSGDPTPSHEDIHITGRLKQAGEIIGIKVLDHIVIGDHSYHSFVEEETAAGQARKAQRQRKGKKNVND